MTMDIRQATPLSTQGQNAWQGDNKDQPSNRNDGSDDQSQRQVSGNGLTTNSGGQPAIGKGTQTAGFIPGENPVPTGEVINTQLENNLQNKEMKANLQKEAQTEVGFAKFTEQTFGVRDAEQVESLRQDILNDNWDWAPQVQIGKADGFNGAFVAGNNGGKILLDDSLHGEQLAKTTWEEMGHAIDYRLRGGEGDAKGDEGQVFAAALSGEKAPASALTENDTGKLNVTGDGLQSAEFSFLGGLFGGIAGGAAGAAAGAVVGPVGAVIGGVAGAVAGAVVGNETTQKPSAPDTQTTATVEDPHKSAFDYNMDLVAQSLAQSAGGSLVNDAGVRAQYTKALAEMRSDITADVASGAKTWEQAAAQANDLRNLQLDVQRGKTSNLGLSIAKSMKETGVTFETLVQKKTFEFLGKHPEYATQQGVPTGVRFKALTPQQIVNVERAFNGLNQGDKAEIYSRIVYSAGKANPTVNNVMKGAGAAGAVLALGFTAKAIYDAEPGQKMAAAASEARNAAASGAGAFVASAGAQALGVASPLALAGAGFVGGVLGVATVHWIASNTSEEQYNKAVNSPSVEDAFVG